MAKKKSSKKVMEAPNEANMSHGDNEAQEGRFDTHNKPQFRSSAAVEEDSKVVLDDRFASVLTDPKYQLDIRDKYGRTRDKRNKNKKKKQPNEELNAFYSIKTDDDNAEAEPEEPTVTKKRSKTKYSNKSKKNMGQSDTDSSSEESENKSDADMDPASRIAYLTALSRGELNVSSSSEEDSESEEEDAKPESDDDDDDDEEDSDNEETAVMGKAGVLDPSYHRRGDTGEDVGDDEEENVDLTFEPSRHLAILNMDWSHIRAADIFAICASFVPPGAVEKVQIYPSDFGMERMAKEDKYGPSNVWRKNSQKVATTDSDSEPDEDKSDDNDQSSDEGESDKKQSSKRAESDDDGSKDDEDEDEEEGEGDDGDQEDYPLENFLPKEDHVESDFDPEKLREYEASRLKYYFAVVYLASEEHADMAYKEVDGMEFEHSSAAIDVRAIPPGELENAIQNRPLHDQATNIPSNYTPPDFVVNALQQTNVKCTWESGDTDRERALTKYTSGQDWKAMAETDDLKAYLASDASSDEEDDEDSDIGKKPGKKSAMMRKMLGLAGSDDDEEDASDSSDDDNDSDEEEGGMSRVVKLPPTSNNSSSSSDSEESEDDNDAGEGSKEARFIPGAKDLSEKIRSKVEQKSSGKLTPWEKFQQKRKEKRQERKEDAREKREEINRARRGGKSKDHKESSDSFFLEDSNDKSTSTDAPAKYTKKTIGKEELELLVAGDDRDESARDYDMRGLQRMDKNKDKKIGGARKRKEAQIAESVAGMKDFEMNLADDRFKSLMDGQDDRFGIDRTDPNFKDTPAMREVLSEQGRRRRKNKKRKTSSQSKEGTSTEKESVPKDAVADGLSPNTTGDGASALSALVSRLKSKVQ
eukprot:CAMPEP_0172440130 /NCGR_PEP_ID=MMETSP1065-20121228/878_1 /TAXON_ID=265537 /ORGANISM="Amphiprora paludosa, Strain CCMP125" /LENGTH=868 /DNA_ID=CAMNT_0013188913 /DNA_START=98 /DNA_END=2705 /DNA_ORIENTATION=-